MAEDINSFLNRTQRKPNQNPKFTDSSPTSSVFGRLGWNFTPADPTILELSAGVKEHLSRMPKLIKDWQAEDMRSGTVNIQNYYVNPVAASSQSLVNILQSIRDSIPNRTFVDSDSESFSFGQQYIICLVPELSEIFESANVAKAELQNFIAHTDRLSNKAKINPDTANLPHYDQAMAIGRQLFYIVYQTDNIQNNAPILGTFTSLFVKPELEYQSNVMSTYASTIANSITITVTGGETEVTTYSSNLSPTQIEAISSNVRLVKTFTETRRRHDENFWVKAQAITDEYQELKGMYGGETQQKLIKDYIGTEELKQKLEIKDVPQKPLFNVNMSWDGTITYESNYDTVNTVVLPTIVVRTTPITGVIDYYEELPTTGNVIGDTYYINTTGETWRWNGTSWVLISKQDPVSPTLTLDEYINQYTSNTLNVAFSGYELRLSPAAINFNTENGIWSPNASIQITNIGTKPYIYSGVSVSNFLNAEVRYTFNPESDVTSNTIGVGNTVTFNVSARSLSEGNTVDYGVITLVPGIRIQTKLTSNAVSYGILLPSEINNNVGSSSARVRVNAVNGPYPILASDSVAPDLFTWRNLSNSSLTISSIVNVTDANTANGMNITFYQATTPNTLNVNQSVLWYANVTPSIEFPNSQTFIVSTTDGQQRTMKIGIDPGNVDDGDLYNEIINSNPDIVATNTNFALRVYGGKPNTLVTISGPTTTNVRLIPANGNLSISYANNVITSNGSYTWIFDFNGTGHRRTITKAIFS